MDADLVGAPRHEAAVEHGDIAEALDDFVKSDGFLAVVAIGEDVHLFAVAQVPADVAGDGAFIGFEITPHQRGVIAFDGAGVELFGKVHHGEFFFGNNHQAGGVFVDAVDKAGAHSGGTGKVFEMIEESVDECACEITDSGMDDQPGLLVKDEEMVIFIYNIERNVFRLSPEIFRRYIEDDGDDIARAHFVIGLYRFAIDENGISAGGILQLIAADAIDAVH